MKFRRAFVSLTLALGVGLAITSPAAAGWITIKNETTQTVIIQETVVVNGQVRRCKPTRLVPGETLREFQATAGQKTVQILEPGLLMNRTLGQGELVWKDSDQGFSILKSGDRVKVLTTEEAVAVAKATAEPMARAQSPEAGKLHKK